MINNYDSVVNCNSSGTTISQEQGETSFTKTKRKWLSFIMVFVALFSFVFVQGQSISNYAFETATTGTLQDLSSGSTSYLAGNQDDASGTVQAIGFNFIFMGVSYTHFSANSNGQMQLHTSSTATAIGTNVTTASGSAILAPFTGDNEVNNGLRYKVLGAAPNRTFVLEWNQFYVNYVNLSNAGNMQVWLEETTGKITYIYGNIYNSSTTSQTRSISIASSNTATTVGSITISATPTFTAGATLVSNTIAAGENPVGVTPIANIGSTTDGSRRYFAFTPISTVLGDVNSITFSGITANSTTVNWVDNTTNEFGFMVTRATDAGFTQNVSSVIVLSTTSAGIGTSYVSNQTSLSAGTEYFYKVTALVEAGQSIGVSGSQATLNGATYYWVGTSTSASPGPFATLSNWNTSADGSGSIPTALANSDTYIIDGNGSIIPGDNVYISLAAATTVGQLKIINNTTLFLESATTTTRTVTISGGPGEDFVIENGSTLNLSNATKASAIAFSGAGNVGTIAGVYNASASTSNTINTTGGTGTLVTVTSTGVVNNSIVGSSGCLLGSVATLSFANGSSYTHSSFTTSNAYVPLATWGASSNIFITGGTTSTSLSNNAQTFGNFTYNSATSTATMSAFTTSTTAVIQGNLSILATGALGGTGIFRATTSGTLTVNGNVFITQGKFQASSTTGTVIANGNTTIAANGVLELSTTGIGGFSQRGNLFTNDGVLTGTSGTLSFVNFTGSAGQTLAGSGTVLTNIASLNMQNTAGLTITHTNPIIVARVNLFQGTITNSNKITFGTGAAVNCTTQIGSAGLTTPGGSFDSAPTFNLGTGTYTLLYQQESVARTSGFEVPVTRILNSLTVNNTNGLILAGGDLTALSTLALTNGIVTTGANTLILGDATTVGTLTGGSDTAYVNGALTRSIANANTNATYIPFPIGKSGVYTPIAIAPATTSIALFKAESFGSNSGTEDPSIIGLSATRRFEALPVSGTFTDINVRLSDGGIVSTNIPVQAPTAAGVYAAAFGSTAAFVAGPPITVTSSYSVTSANYTGYLSYANSNSCSGTPAPGNTIASTNAICLGQSVNLSIQTIPTGSGITYQWKSSNDGINYSVIDGATSATLSVTPTQVTFYICDVTCSSGPSTGTSTAVQITFSNSVISATPGTRCGTGTVDLSAVPSIGANLKWYAAATGGTALASGTLFTTPTISATTTYYAGAESSTSGSVIIGSANTLTGATTQPSAFVNRWPSYRIQTLYTAAELNAAGLSAGNITSMSYFTTTLGDAATNSNFVVKIGTTSQSAMTTAWLPTTSYTTVYGPVTHTHTAIGEQPINFTTPFNWDGESNIVIEVMYNGADITNNAITYFTSTTNNMVVHSNTSGSTAASGTVTTSRLNLKLNGQVACSSDRMPVVATVTAPPALNLSSSAATICEGSSTSTVTLTSTVGDYTTYTWSPSTGVSGNMNEGWNFNPSITTNYTLTASQAPQNIINNGDFSNGLTSWTNFVANWIPVNANFLAANNEANITGITGAGGQPWFVQLNQVFTPAQIASLEIGSSYKITFSARSTVNNRSLKLFFGEDGGGFIPLYEQNYSISNAIANYETNVFTVGQTFGGMKLGFEMGLMNDDVFIDNVTLTKIIPSICNTSTSFNVTVNPRPTALAIAPSPANVCVDVIQPLVANGGTIGGLNNSQIGTATTLTSATSQPTAFCNRFKHYWVQMVYTAAELTAAGVQPGNITALSFTTGAQGSANNVTDFKVRIGNTTNNVLTGFTSSGLTQVFSVATYPTVVGVNTITFDTPYVWDGVSNIIVDMRQTGVDSINNSTTQYTATTGNTVVSAITSTTNAGGSDGFAGTLPSATTSVNRLNTTFQWDSSVPTTITWSPDTNLYTDALATIPYVANSNASTVYFKSSTVAGATTYTATSTSGAGCTRTATVDVTVNPLPTVVTVAPAAVCAGTTVDLTATAVTTGSDVGLTYTYFTNIEATNALTTPAAVTTSGTYYIKGTNTNGCTAVTPVTVTVNPLPVIVVTNPATVCSPSTVDITATTVTSGSDSGLTFTYFTDLAATNALTNPNVVTTSGTYYIKGTNANGCSSIASVNVTINVTSAPTGDATQTFCGASNITQLIAVGSGIKWYDAATGGNLLPNITAIGLTNGTTYYASQTVNGCESTDRFAVTVVVNTIPTAPNASAQSFCNSATVADLLPSGSSYNWYSAATGGTALASSDVLSSNTYYVSQTLNGCESARTAVTVTINTTAAPTAADQSFCNSALVANLTATGTNLSWYLASIGGSALSPSTSLTSTTYYVSQTLNGCESSRTAVLVTVNTTSAPTAIAQTFCTSATVADLTASGSNLSWYSNSTGGTALTSGTTLSTGIYYVSQNVDGCESPRTAVNVTISTPSTPTGNAVQTIYGGVASDATIEDINVNGSNIVWYPTPGDAAAGTNAIPAGTQLVDGAIYYAVSVVGTCRSAALAVTVTVVLDNASFDIKSLKYYPNPVVDRFTVSYTKLITAIQVYDINGRLVKNLQTNSNEVNVDMSDVAASVYIVKVFADDTMGEFKVVKTE